MYILCNGGTDVNTKVGAEFLEGCETAVARDVGTCEVGCDVVHGGGSLTPRRHSEEGRQRGIDRGLVDGSDMDVRWSHVEGKDGWKKCFFLFEMQCK